MRLDVLWVVLAFCRFTVMLTLVVPSVGVLPVLLLATVMNRFLDRRSRIKWTPPLGPVWVTILALRSVLRIRSLVTLSTVEFLRFLLLILRPSE